MEYVVDRVKTTSNVWLGMTFECAQCHDHMYDPFSQQEYYQMFAFLTTTQTRACKPAGKYCTNGEIVTQKERNNWRFRECLTGRKYQIEQPQKTVSKPFWIGLPCSVELKKCRVFGPSRSGGLLSI